MKYKSLIQQLSDRLKKQIYPNLHNVVVLFIENSVKVHIELDPTEEYLIIGAFIGDLPPGKFREHILKDALKSNFSLQKNKGILSYIGKENTLTVHTKLLLEKTTIDSLMQCLKDLTKRAQSWQEAFEEGKSSPTDEIPKSTHRKKGSIFGF
jgi:hypothetical protein